MKAVSKRLKESKLLMQKYKKFYLELLDYAYDIDDLTLVKKIFDFNKSIENRFYDLMDGEFIYEN